MFKLIQCFLFINAIIIKTFKIYLKKQTVIYMDYLMHLSVIEE